MAALQQIPPFYLEKLKRLQNQLQQACKAYIEEIDMECISLLEGFTWMDYLSHPDFLNFVHDPGVWGVCFGTYGGKAGKG